ESMPNALLEGMGMGLPIVAASAGGVPEIVGRNGLLVQSGDTEGMAKALEQAVLDHEQRRAWAGESRKRFEEFTAKRKIERTETVYLEALANKELAMGRGGDSA
ncbi:MAG: glycosyltransferase, partial [Desulfovibrio sp.]